MSSNTEVVVKEHGTRGMEQRRECIHSTQADHPEKWRYNLNSSLSGRWRQTGVREELQGLTCSYMRWWWWGRHSKSIGRGGILRNGAWVNLELMGWNEEIFPTKEILWVVRQFLVQSYFWLKIVSIISSIFAFWLINASCDLWSWCNQQTPCKGLCVLILTL